MPAFKNDNGFTLLEFMVAVLILMVGLLGLLQTINMAISTNMVTQLRNMGIVAADQILSDTISRIDRSVACPSTPSISYTNVQMKVLNAYKNYSATVTTGCAVQSTTNSYKVDVQLRWKYKNTLYNHDASSIVYK